MANLPSWMVTGLPHRGWALALVTQPCSCDPTRPWTGVDRSLSRRCQIGENSRGSPFLTAAHLTPTQPNDTAVCQRTSGCSQQGPFLVKCAPRGSGCNPRPLGPVRRAEPVHRTPAKVAVLAPRPDDPIVPSPRSRGGNGAHGHRKAGTIRTKNQVGKRFRRDLEIVGIPHRRFHDTQRTFISLAQAGGAQREHLLPATHTSGCAWS